MFQDILDSIVQVQAGEIGTGFLVSAHGLIVTCAHVIGKVKRERVVVCFQRAQVTCNANVLGFYPDEDIAFLRVKEEELPTSANFLYLGTSAGTDGHTFNTFGYPVDKYVNGSCGSGTILGSGMQTIANNPQPLLQISSSDITAGFSGGPTWDEARQRVVGVIDIVAGVDGWGKRVNNTYTIPSETVLNVAARCQLDELCLSEICPYQELNVFTQDKENFFFGRQHIVNDCLASLKREVHFLAIFGPSGCGKSSLVQAGLIPQLERGAILDSEHWSFTITRPFSSSFREQIMVPDSSERTVLVIDQFEELFVNYPCENGSGMQQDASAIIDQLVDMVKDCPKITMIIVMRNDFYSRFMRHEGLAQFFSLGFVNVSLSIIREDLDKIIRCPAEKAGWQFEKGLIDTIINDVIGASEGSSASSTLLPLLEYTLTQLWKESAAGIMTHACYQKLGGVTGGLTNRATETYHKLTPPLPDLAREIFLSLVHVGDKEQNIPDSPVRRPLTSLPHYETAPEDVSFVVEQFVKERLLTISDNESLVEIIHDVLLRKWQILYDWINVDRRFQLWYQQINKRVQDWVATHRDATKRDVNQLFTGIDLSIANYWLENQKWRLSQDEQNFIVTSRQRVRNQLKRQQRLISVLSIILVVLLSIGCLAAFLYQRNVEETQTAQNKATLALSRELAVQSKSYLARNQIEDAFLLAVKAYQVSNNYDSRDALFNALKYSPHLASVLRHDPRHIATAGTSTSNLIYSADGATLLSSDEAHGAINAWDLKTRKSHFLSIPGGSGLDASIRNMVASPNRKLFASASLHGIALWDLQSQRQIAQLGAYTDFNQNDPTQTSMQALAFSPNGKYLAAGDCAQYKVLSSQPSDLGGVDYCAQGRISLWDVANRTLAHIPWFDPTGMVCGLSFSSDGSHLASKSCNQQNSGSNFITHACAPGKVTLWDMTQTEPTGQVLPVDNINAVAFSLNKPVLAMGNSNGAISLWDTAAGQFLNLPFFGHQGQVCALAFDPNSSLLASGGEDKTVRLWDATTAKAVGAPFLGHDATVSCLAFSPDSQHLISGDTHHAILAWDMQSFLGSSQTIIPQDSQASPAYGVMAFNAKTNLLALSMTLIASPAINNKIQIVLWNTASGKINSTIEIKPSPSNSFSTFALAISSDGRLLAISYAILNQDHDPVSYHVILWNTVRGQIAGNLMYKNQKTLAMNDLTFSADDKNLIGIGLITTKNGQKAQKSTVFWNVSTRKVINQDVASVAPGFTNLKVVSAQNSNLVVTSYGSHIHLWDATTGMLKDNKEYDLGANIFAMAMSPDGRLLAIGDTINVVVWDIDTKKPVNKPFVSNDFSVDDNKISNIKFSSDGKLVIVGGMVQNALWDKQSNDFFIGNFNDQDVFPQQKSGNSFIVSMTPNDQLLTFDYQNNSIFRWNMNVQSWLTHACSMANREFTQEEWRRFMPDEAYQPMCPGLPAPNG